MDRIDVKRLQLQTAWNEARRGGGQLVVGQVMTAAPSCIDSQTSVLELVKMFHAKEFRHLLVVDAAGNLQGVVSDRDVIRCFGPGKYPRQELLAQIRAERIMSTDVITVQPDTALDKAVQIMLEQGISCLPVVIERRTVGILTNTDIQIILHELLQSDLLKESAAPEWVAEQCG
ncbi:MAG TPA: CBS domain-containing protein [Pirellulales bacterium]|jgi:acetoin utilization protein AcuB|nr:CBS domain-containing protein [Pirellulales bacterium]